MDARFPYSLVLAFVWLLVMRGMLILHSGVWPAPLTTILSDIAGAFLLVVLLYLFREWLPRMIFVLVVGLAFFVAGEHISTHGTLFRIVHVGQAIEPIFVSASIIHPRLFLLPVYCAMVWLLIRVHNRIIPVVPRITPAMLVAAGIVIIVYMLATFSLTLPGNNVIASALSQIPSSILHIDRPPETIEDTIPIDDESMEEKFFHREVAEPEIGKSPNILLIMIEGLSSGYFPEVSRYHNLDPEVQLEVMEKGLENNGFRIYRNVLTLQRKTDRGTYPLLCGDYPRLTSATPKMTDIAMGKADPLCLPELLSDAGYRTVYWQAAPLEFMNKKTFMPRIGFQIVEGSESFPDKGNHEGWGPPDRMYFPEIARRLSRLDGGALPWFVTMLNIGTHHPFPVDGKERENNAEISSLSLEERQQRRRVAMNAMEQELLEFLEMLSSDGILSDTLVLITSDESGGFLRKEKIARPLDGNFGALAVLPPDHMSLISFADKNAIVSQLDIPLTILDLVGPVGKHNMMGRSLLVRNSNSERGLLLGDAYSGNQYLMLERGRLLACTEGMIRCNSLRFDSERLFGSLTAVDEEPILDLPTRRNLVKRAGLINPRENAP